MTHVQLALVDHLRALRRTAVIDSVVQEAVMVLAVNEITVRHFAWFMFVVHCVPSGAIEPGGGKF